MTYIHYFDVPQWHTYISLLFPNDIHALLCCSPMAYIHYFVVPQWHTCITLLFPNGIHTLLCCSLMTYIHYFVVLHTYSALIVSHRHKHSGFVSIKYIQTVLWFLAMTYVYMVLICLQGHGMCFDYPQCQADCALIVSQWHPAIHLIVSSL